MDKTKKATESTKKDESKEKKESKKDDKSGKKENEEEEQLKKGPSLPQRAVIHPLVLLNSTDHYSRSNMQGTNKRVVGILLGEVYKGKVDVTNSFAVPFEEDAKDPKIWYLDHNYHEEMFAMYRKVAAKEKVVGWYSTGPKIRPADLEIHELIRKYTAHPVLCIIDVNPRDDIEIPIECYLSVESAPEEKSTSRRTFLHLPVEIGALEAEEVGVEHLLRNIRDTTISTVADEVNNKLTSLKGLEKRLCQMYVYLDNVVKGKMPVNHQIIYNLQNIFNLSPDLKDEELVKAFAIKNNDNMMARFLFWRSCVPFLPSFILYMYIFCFVCEEEVQQMHTTILRLNTCSHFAHTFSFAVHFSFCVCFLLFIVVLIFFLFFFIYSSSTVLFLSFFFCTFFVLVSGF